MGQGAIGAYGLQGLQQAIRQRVADEMAAKQHEQEMQMAERRMKLSEQEMGMRHAEWGQQREDRQMNLARQKQQDEQHNADRELTQAEKLNESMPADTVVPKDSPLVGRLQMVGGLKREGAHLPSTQFNGGAVIPGDGGMIRGTLRMANLPGNEEQFRKVETAGQLNTRTDNERQAKHDDAAIEAKIQGLNQAAEHLRMQGEVNAANILKAQAEVAATRARAEATTAKTAGATGGPSPYTQERTVRNLQSVDELMGKVNNWTSGAGSVLANLPATDARNFAAELTTLKANIAFGELSAMREASKTGGALGQVSDREEALLSSTLGALDPGQSPANLKAQLQKVKESIQRWQAVAGMKPAVSHGGAPAAAPAAPAVEHWERGPDGKPRKVGG